MPTQCVMQNVIANSKTSVFRGHNCRESPFAILPASILSFIVNK